MKIHIYGIIGALLMLYGLYGVKADQAELQKCRSILKKDYEHHKKRPESKPIKSNL